MALSISTQVQNILRTWYKDDVSNLLFRNDPAIKEIAKTRVEGKEQAFAAIYGAGGAVSSNFTNAKTQAAETARNAEFKVTPGQLFSVYSMNAQEVQASLTRKGAYMKVAGNKLFAATEALRRTLAACFYGDGYGVVGSVTGSATIATISTSGTELTFADPSVAMKLDVGSVVQFKSDKTSADSASKKAEVTKIDGNKVTFKAASTINLTSGTEYFIQLQGSVDSSGNPLLPMGLEGWLPTDSTARAGTFCGVNRSYAPDRLAGALVDDSAVSTATKSATLKKLILKCRRAGSMADLIVMNDEDFLALSAEIETTNTYLSKIGEGNGQKKATVGISELSAAVSTNFVQNIVDSPYCPKGVFYVLDKSAIELWSMTNTDALDNGVAGNGPGKQDPMTMDNDGHAKDPAQLIIDDYVSVTSGEGDANGPNVLVTLQLFASFVVTNPSVCGVGKFYAA